MGKIKKILISNRGEIASRIIKTCKNMGIQTISIFSEADKNSKYVKEADESVYIGKSESLESYLNIDKIIKVAKDYEADAIHPGYGFLSENPEFCKKVEGN
jgi:acetyl-CoA carboxylase, biotin carboxylase subunit